MVYQRNCINFNTSCATLVVALFHLILSAYTIHGATPSMKNICLKDGEEKTVTFTSTINITEIKGYLEPSNNFVISGSADPATQQYSLTISASTLKSNTIPFGSYNISVILVDTANNQTSFLKLYFEEAIETFQISYGQSFIPVNETVTFSFNLAKGSNVKITWYSDSQMIRLTTVTGSNGFENFMFTTNGMRSVTAVASNTVSNGTATLNVQVRERVPLSGFALVQSTLLMDQSDTGVINIIYTSGDTPTLCGIVDTGPVLNGNVNDVAHTGVLNIPSSTFSSYGTYRILVILENFLGNLTEEAVIHYEQSISGFQVSLNVPFAPINEVISLQYTFTKGSNINMNWMHNGVTFQSLDIDGSVLSGQITKTFTVVAIHNITVIARNNISSSSSTIEVNARYRVPLSGFAVNETTILMDQSDTGVINMIYAAGDTPTLRGILDTGAVLNGVVNDVAYTGVLNIPFSTFSSYGTYKILMVLDNYLGNLTQEAIIHYEQSIAGFQLTFNEPFAPIDETVSVQYSFTKGSNINMDWMHDGVTFDTTFVSGPPLSGQITKTFSAIALHNITVIAQNNLSLASDTIYITARHRVPLSGFTLNETTVLMDQSDTGVINMIYAAGDTPTLRGILDTGAVLNGVVNDVAYTGVLNIPFSTFSSYGTYKILMVLDNYLGNLTQEAIIHYEQSIAGFEMSFNEPFAPLNESVLINYAFTRGSNIKYNMMFNGTTVEDFDIEGVVLSVNRNWTFITTGLYNVTVEVSNNISEAVDSLEITARLRIPVSGFNVSKDNVLLNYGETVSFDFTYAAGDYPVLKGYLDFGTVIDGTVNQETRNGSCSIASHLFSSQTFGTYGLLLELGNKAGNETKQLVVHYEEKIEGLQLNFSQSFAPLNETVTFTYTMAKGSNIRLYLRGNDTEITIQDLEGVVRTGNINVTFNEYAVLNISLEARNNISSSVASLIVIAREREPISGFNISDDSLGPVHLKPGTTKVMNITFDAGDNPVLQGVITDVTTISGILDLLLHKGTVIIDSNMFSSKPYGTYNLTLELSNKANSQSHQLPIYYEQAIEGFQVTFLHPYAPMNEDVLFEYVFTSGSNIRMTWLRENFTIDTLDISGTPRSGQHNLTFDTPGIYNMTIETRNTLSSSVFSLILTARYRIPVYNFALLPHKDVIYLTQGNSTVINFSYITETGSDPQMYATIDTGVKMDGIVNVAQQNGSLTIDSSFLTSNNVSYGTYNLTMVVWNDEGNDTRYHTLSYEEIIQDFKLHYDSYFVPIHEYVVIYFTNAEGSNMNVEWTHENSITNQFYEGKTSYGYLNGTFDIERESNVSANVYNNVSQVSGFINFTVRHRVPIGDFKLIPDEITLVNMREGENLTFTFTFVTETGTPPILLAQLDYGTNQTGDINHLAYNGTLTISDDVLLAGVPFGAYNLTLLLYNDKGNQSKNIALNYDQPIEDFKVTYDEDFVPILEMVLFNISLSKGSNVRLTLYYGNNMFGYHEYSGINLQWMQEAAIDVPGTYNLVFRAANSVSNVTTEVPIIVRNRIPVNGSTVLHLTSNIINLHDDKNITIYFIYTAGDKPKVNGYLNSDYEFSGEVDFQNKNGSITLVPSEILSNNITFGSYPLRLVLGNKAGNQSQKFTVNFEEPVTNLNVYMRDYSLHVPVEESITFMFELLKGSNINVKWFSNRHTASNVSYTGPIRMFDMGIVFPEPGSYDLVFNVSNSLSYSVKYVSVIAQYRIHGFSIYHNSEPVSTTTNATFTVYLDLMSNIEMGNVSLEIKYGNGDYQYVDFNITSPPESFTSIVTTVSYETTTTTTINNSSNSSDWQTEKITTTTLPPPPPPPPPPTLYEGVVFTYHYQIQGNYSVEFTIWNEISSEKFDFTTYIWDTLNMTFESNKTIAKVDEELQFMFDNLPNAGFMFILDYGDGNVVRTEEEVYFSLCNVSTFIHSFVAPAVYSVLLSAWNPFFTYYQQIDIIVQHPIPAPDIILIPETIEIPIPDGIVTFSLIVTKEIPKPTNVTCTYDYGDALKANKTAIIKTNSPLNKTHVFSRSGIFNVYFNCSNKVSFMSKYSRVSVQGFNLDNFRIDYAPIVGMNMTDNSTYVPVDVIFTISLFNVSKQPPDINITWNFNDGTPIESDNLDYFTKLHRFTKRGIYEIEVKITDLENPDSNRTMPIKIGAIDFTSNRLKGSVMLEDFIYTATGLVDGTYMFSCIPNEPLHHVTNETARYVVNYPDFGSYYPYVIGINDTFQETVYFTQEVIFNYYFSDLIFTTNTTVMLPTGETQFIISIPEFAQPLPFVVCSIDMADFIENEQIDMKQSTVQNITYDTPIVFNYTYLTLGVHDVSANCSNPLTNKSEFYEILGLNGCFRERGIFDRQYSRKSNPMRVYTSMETHLSNRMPIRCSDANVEFDWKFLKKNVHNDDYELIYKELPKRQTGMVQFARGEMAEGLYKVTLNISLSLSTIESTYVYERTYIEFEKPPPYATIVGGTKRTSKMSMLEIDALTKSYDTDHGEGDNSNLTFRWYCNRFNTSELEALEQVFNEIIGNTTDNGIENLKLMSEGETTCNQTSDNTTGGIFKLDATKADYKGYILLVEVCVYSIKGDICTPFTQLLQTVQGQPPDAFIECIINCKEKYAVTSQLNLHSLCADCDDYEKQLLTYEWVLMTSEGTTINITDMTHGTGSNRSTFVLKPNVLEPGKVYQLCLTMTVIGETRKAPGHGIIRLNANYPPYGGSCKITPTSGSANDTLFVITCKDWKDEGTRDVRLASDDKNEPLKFTYSCIIKQFTAQGDIFYSTLSLFTGSERTASELLLPVGDDAFNHTIIITVRISDRYGDFTDYNISAQVFPVAFPENLDDEETIQTFKEAYDDHFYKDLKEVEAGENKMAVGQRIASSASVFLLSNQTSNLKSDSPLKTFMSDIAANLTGELKHILNRTATNNEHLSPGVVSQLTRTIRMCTENSKVVNSKTIENAAKSFYTLMEDMRKSVDTKPPFEVDKIHSMVNAIDDVLTITRTSLGVLLPENLIDPDEQITAESVQEDVQAALKQYNTSTMSDEQLKTLTDKLTEEIIAQKTTMRNEQTSTKQTAKNSVPEMMSAIVKSQELLLKLIEIDQSERVITKNDMEVSVEKLRLYTNSNTTTRSRKGIKMVLENDNTTESEQDELELGMTYFEKPPHIYGHGSANVTSPSMSISAKRLNGTAVKLNTTLKFPNRANAFYSKHVPTTIPGDPDKMTYFKYNNKNKNDASIIYIKPDILDVPDYNTFLELFESKNFDLYDIYAHSKTHPTTTKYEFKEELNIRNWEHPYGFKVFITPGSLEGGDAFVALKPQQSATSGNSDAGSNTAKRRRRRSISSDNTTIDANATTPATDDTFNPQQANFSVIVVTTGCRKWDEAQQAWVSDGCQVSTMSDVNETICLCSVTSLSTTFATTFYVPPNTIDFSKVFSKFDASNASVYGTVIALIVLYIACLIWARRQDKKDLIRWEARFLMDTDSSDTYFYLMTIYTGLRKGSGTRSNINFVLAGEDTDTGVRYLNDESKKEFPTCSVRKFIMGTEQPLGQLTYLSVWHDNAGVGIYKSWYFHKAIIQDLQTNQRYIFMCDQWLALDQGDGLVERTVPVYASTEDSGFGTMFSEHARYNVTENHLWLSMFMRPEKSNFTRVQRLSCIVSMLFLAMITNAMFFEGASTNTEQSSVNMGSMRLSLKTIYVSAISIVITTIPVAVVGIIFRKVRPKITKTEPRQEKYMEQIKKNNPHLQHLNVDRKNKRCMLPHWVIFIAWIIVVLSILTSGFFLILYSMEWGKSVSEEWLCSFVLSFTESLFFVDPFKVICIAVIMALIIRQPVDDSEDEIDLDAIRTESSTFDNGSYRTLANLKKTVYAQDEEFQRDQMIKMKEQIKQKSRAKRTLLELIMYGIYVLAVFSISYVNRDDRSYMLNEHIKKELVDSSKTQFGFSKVTSAETFFTWLNLTLFPKYFPTTNFDDATSLDVRDRLFFGDLANHRVGPARLRQVRMQSGPCHLSGIETPRPCVDRYDLDFDDEQSYCLRWTPYDSSCDLKSGMYYTEKAWNYTKAKDIWGIPIKSEYNIYGGGGYILNFEVDLTNSRLLISELMEYMWIDRGTRAVFMEFTFYNPNTNLFVYVIFLLELTELGVVTWNDIRVFRPYQMHAGVGAYIIVCYFIYIIALIISTVKAAFQIKTTGVRYFVEYWTILDIFCILIGYTLIVMWSLRYVYANRTMSSYRENIDNFVNFQHIVIWDYVFSIFMGFLVFLCTLRLLRILGYSKRMTQLASVLSLAAKEIFSFLIMFCLAFFAFAACGFLLFGSSVKDYRSLFSTLGSLSNSLIGRNSLDKMIQYVPAFAQIYYIVYVFFMIFILITIFMAILNQSISEVKAEVMRDNQYGIIDVITEVIQDITGISFKKSDVSNKTPSKGKGQYQQPSQNEYAFDTLNMVKLVRETFAYSGLKGLKDSDDEKELLDDKEKRAKTPQAFEQNLLIDNQVQRKVSFNLDISTAYI